MKNVVVLIIFVIAFILSIKSLYNTFFGDEPAIQNQASSVQAQVSKKDGSIDERPDDLKELCKDYLYYRNKIAKANNEEDAAGYRRDFQKVNTWLGQYRESDVQAMFSQLEREGYQAP